MTLSSRLALPLAALLMLGAPFGSPASAQDSAAQPDGASAANAAGVQFIESHQQALRTVLRQRASDRRQATLTQKLGEMVDFDRLAQTALSRHWDELEEAQRQEFSGLLRQLIERSYLENLSATLEYDVSQAGTEERRGDLVVKTIARSTANRRAPEITIDYRLHGSGDAMRVVDITTDGVSLVRTYRRQFRRVIDRDGFPALIAKMQQRLSES